MRVSKKFIKENIALIRLYRFRSLLLIILLLMTGDIEYNDWKAMIIPLSFFTTFSFFFYLDHFGEIRKNKNIFLFLKVIYIILSTIIVIFINIVTSHQIVLETGFSHNNFTIAIPLLFFISLLIVMFPLVTIILLLMGMVYEVKIFHFINKINTKKFIKFLHSVIMFILPIIIYQVFWAKIFPFLSDNIIYPFRDIFVYSAYQDIPEQCINKKNLKNKFGKDIKMAFIDNKIISIAIPISSGYKKTYMFLEGECKR